MINRQILWLYKNPYQMTNSYYFCLKRGLQSVNTIDKRCSKFHATILSLAKVKLISVRRLKLYITYWIQEIHEFARATFARAYWDSNFRSCSFQLFLDLRRIHIRPLYNVTFNRRSICPILSIYQANNLVSPKYCVIIERSDCIKFPLYYVGRIIKSLLFGEVDIPLSKLFNCLLEIVS